MNLNNDFYINIQQIKHLMRDDDPQKTTLYDVHERNFNPKST